MLVRDLIAETEWYPSRRGKWSPTLSILLPTYRRGSDGLFIKAAQSVLSQTFTDLELIIVDDASVDGTLDQVRVLMESDPRVSLLRHPKNVGLPAVSEYEAYLRSQGTLISFAFDDFLFEPDAFDRLLQFRKQTRAEVVHGIVEAPYLTGEIARFGDASNGYDKLRWMNFIGNAGVVLPREVIETVGFYDPHVILTRLCDWDLWLRIYKRFTIAGTPFKVGSELGSSRLDSLGHTYPMRFEVVQEFMAAPRDNKLIPGNMENRNVSALPSSCSLALEKGIREVNSFFVGKFWSSPVTSYSATKARPSIVSVYGQCNASVSLYFVADQSPLRTIRFIEPSGNNWYENSQIVTSEAVIFVREFLSERHSSALRLCRLASIPHIYFCDDNFNALRLEDPAWSAYSLERMRSELTTFVAVLVSSQSLRKFFIENALHENVHVISPLFDEVLYDKIRRTNEDAPAKNDSELRVTYFGGPFRNFALLSDVFPALESISSSVRLQVRKTTERYPPTSLSVEFEASSLGFSHFLEKWSQFRPDIVVHPRGATNNIQYKSENAILVACYLGAVPILADEPAYEGVGVTDGVVKAGPDSAQWYWELRTLTDSNEREVAYQKLLSFCRHNFSPEATWQTLNQVLNNVVPLTEDVLDERYHLAVCYTPSGSVPPDRYNARVSDERASDIIKQKSDAVATDLVRKRRFEANVEGLYLKGWASFIGASDPSQLELYIDGRPQGTISANIFREDLAEAGKGDGHRAFLIPVSPAIGDGRVHHFELRLVTDNRSLVKFRMMSAGCGRGLLPLLSRLLARLQLLSR